MHLAYLKSTTPKLTRPTGVRYWSLFTTMFGSMSLIFNNPWMRQSKDSTLSVLQEISGEYQVRQPGCFRINPGSGTRPKIVQELYPTYRKDGRPPHITVPRTN